MVEDKYKRALREYVIQFGMLKGQYAGQRRESLERVYEWLNKMLKEYYDIDIEKL